MRRLLRAYLGLAGVAAGCALFPASVVAQGGVRLIPQLGLYVPLSDLGRASSGSQVLEIGKKESTLGLGLALELAARRRLSYRLNAAYGTKSDIPVSGVGCEDCQLRSTVAALTGSLVWRPLPTLLVVQPYLQLGGGLKRYDFDEEDARAEGLEAFSSDANELTGHLGAGIELSLLGMRAIIELSDFVNGFDLPGGAEAEGETQHDFFFVLGLSLGG